MSSPATTTSSPPRVNWASVGVFYALACAISWPFMWWRDLHPVGWAAWRAPELLKHASYMWGPGVSALVCLRLFGARRLRATSLLGSSPSKSLAFYLLPLATLALLGGKEFAGMSGHVFPLAAALFSFLTIFGEELGWRGYLQEALLPLRAGLRYGLIGLLWEAWHFTTRTHEGTTSEIALRLLVMIPSLALLSFVIGEAVRRSRSLLVAQTLHLWFDLVFQASSWQATTVCIASIGFWAWLLRSWVPAVDHEAAA